MPWKNKQAQKAYAKAYYQKNKEGAYQRTKHNIYKWRENNTEKLKQISKEWYAKNKDKNLLQQKQYRDKNKDLINSKDRERTKNLDDRYMKKHLTKLGYSKEAIQEYPEILETHKIIIKTKRL